MGLPATQGPPPPQRPQPALVSSGSVWVGATEGLVVREGECERAIFLPHPLIKLEEPDKIRKKKNEDPIGNAPGLCNLPAP